MQERMRHGRLLVRASKVSVWPGPGLVRFDLEKGGGVCEKLPADGSLSFEQRIRQAKNIIFEGFK